MRQVTVVAIAGAIALAISSCASEDASVAPSPGAKGSPAATASPAAGSPAAGSPAAAPVVPGAGKTAVGKLSTPLVAQKPGAGPTIPGLIQSTNGDERAKQVQTSINSTKAGKDPFKGLPPEVSRIPITIKTPQTAPNVPLAPRTGTGGRGVSPGTPSVAMKAPNIPSPNHGGSGGSGGSDITKSVPLVPTPPSTTLASAVEVTGIVTVNGVTQAIIKAPNEDTSRYVRVGQRLSNGQVLVKRIDSYAGSDPVVILEQNGVEVARVVGDKPLAAAGGKPVETPPPPAPAKPAA